MSTRGGKATRRGYCIIFASVFNKKRALVEAKQRGEGTASYLNKDLIRNEHRWRQCSKESISHHIPNGIQLEANTGEDEAGQPRVDSASYLNGDLIRNEHRRRQGSEERISHHISIGSQ